MVHIADQDVPFRVDFRSSNVGPVTPAVQYCCLGGVVLESDDICPYNTIVRFEWDPLKAKANCALTEFDLSRLRPYWMTTSP